jgi:hypothetical protein
MVSAGINLFYTELARTARPIGKECRVVVPQTTPNWMQPECIEYLTAVFDYATMISSSGFS